jgi:demethylspheroidene O-methyltransferase
VAQAAPRSGLMLFDLPAVAETARERLAAAGLGARADVHGGDFTRDALPAGADLVTLVRILHDHDDAIAQDLLRRVHAALPPGGRVLIAEPMAGTPGAEPMGEAYFGFYLLAMGRGRPRRAEEIMRMLAEAGFVQARRLRTATPLLTQVLVADVGRG